ncbi:metal ABC transporter solute-binding protein, Zn/Mn family [Cytobacillus firmus]|uniref:metal ABC transporter solute-binding protein, Zn/Mn family n=1 Tax=Cytobacillus firmus TaxID=1399 RepID=UPI00222812B8|nr:ZinT/AdcA family metal-binding protein [Cytobacillus firmus]
MFKKFAGILILFTVIFTLAACGEKAANSSESEKEALGSNEELKILTTVYPLQFFAEQIAGDQASVDSILPLGADTHTYEPTTNDMIKIAESDAFIYNGAGLDSYAEQISESIQSEDVKILEASKGIKLEKHVHNHEGEGGSHESDHTHEEEGSHEEEHAGHNHGDQDPHVWLDPIRSIQQAEHIKDLLVELKPEQEEIFNQNFEELKGKLENLDQDFRAQLESLPGNKIIVSHAAYGYWEKAYGIEQIAVSGLSPANEPSHKEVQTIIKTAEKYGLKHVFFEQNVTPKVADSVRKEIDAEALRIHNLSVLTEEDIKTNEDYFTLMQHNLEELTIALSEPSSVGTSETDEQGEHDHSHTHPHNEETAKIYKGYFENSQVKDRSLSDWEGDWQSVYPYLQDGTLDEVFTYKAEHEGEMTSKEYKEYYNEGYQTNVGRIVIQGNKVTFFKNGEEYSGEYIYDGYEILTYDAGNRGVRYVFKLEVEAEGLPQYIQFSDHSIYPTEADHYHLYWGDDREKLLNEVTNWPTYYPSEMDGHDIAHEMMAH